MTVTIHRSGAYPSDDIRPHIWHRLDQIAGRGRCTLTAYQTRAERGGITAVVEVAL